MFARLGAAGHGPKARGWDLELSKDMMRKLRSDVPGLGYTTSRLGLGRFIARSVTSS
jgi:hypothetical protein